MDTTNTFITNGWWEIKCWTPNNNLDEHGPKFPHDGGADGRTMITVKDKTGTGGNVFWADENHMPCCVRFPVDPGSLVTFAGVNIPIETGSLTPDPADPKRIIITLISGPKGMTGNTGTFIAQAIPDPGQPPYKPGHERPRD